MKADPSAPAFAPELDVPSWVPEPVAHSVRTKYAAAVHAAYANALMETGDAKGAEEADALVVQDAVRDAYADFVREDLADIAEQYRRLVCDHRMRGVWRELSRRHNGAFLHPALAASVVNAKERQAAAMVEIFNTAFACQSSSQATTTRRQVEQRRNRYLAKAKELRDDALRPAGSWEFWRRLKDAAAAYEEYANRFDATNFPPLERKHDGRARWVALTIGNKFHALFGSPMYGLTATISSVVLGREIDPRRVRQWCARHPAVKKQKIVL